MSNQDKTREELIAELAEERRRSQSILETFFGASSVIFAVEGEQLRFLKANQITASYFGLDTESIVGRSLQDLAPQVLREYGPAVRQIMETGKPLYNVEVSGPVPSRGGAIASWRISGFPVSLPGGKQGLGLVGMEITDLKRAKEALQQSNEQLQTIYEGMIEGLLITDIETKRFVRANSPMCRMLGYCEAELLAASIQDIHPPEEVPNDLQRFQAAAEGRVSINEGRPVLRKDGSIFYADITGHRIMYEGRPCLLALFRDITERRQVQESLRQSHDELRAIYDQVIDGILIADGQSSSIIRANPAFCRILGYSEAELRTVFPEKIHLPEMLPMVREHCQAALQGGIARTDEFPFVRKDGRIIYVDVVSRQITYDGRLGWISFFHDVTERRQARVALEREQRTLQHMLQASDHERQLIAYDIHDGLAQQLAGAIMQFQVYEQFKDSKPEEARKAYDGGLTLLRQGNVEARRLISGVRPPILDESGVVAAIAHLVQDPAFQQGPTIDFRSRVAFQRLAPVLENAVYRIVQEGLANARNHSESKRILIGLAQRDDHLRIEIRDWGVGFNPRTVQENRFGLEGIRERARLLGGKCIIKSKPGAGTSIIVRLPIVE